ncbi:MAG: nitroreductase family protein [Candidatus Aureabacteria bacterium]|nr:nitroreductase family protein [Candidatus Auribacterota bacterium]
MKFLELIDKRKSTRSFTEKQIQEEDIIKCVEAARLAPSACNSQPWKFVIVRDREKKEMVAGAALSGLFTDAAGMNRLLREAGVIVALVNEKMKISARAGAVVKGTDYSLLDIGIAGEHFILQAAELGIGTCWVGWFNEKKVKQVLKVPKNLRIPCLIAMGYPKRDDETPKKRKPLDEIMSFDEY